MCNLMLEFQILIYLFIYFYKPEINNFLWLSIVVSLQHLK